MIRDICAMMGTMLLFTIFLAFVLGTCPLWSPWPWLLVVALATLAAQILFVWFIEEILEFFGYKFVEDRNK